jgi:hypothetical protein
MSLTRRGRQVSFVTALVAVALTAFLGGAEAKKTKAGKGKAPAAASECKVDADCVAVPDDCCSCNEGGKQRAILKKDQAAYEKDRKKRCAETMCTEVMSQDPTCSQKPYCLAGICELADPS